MTDLYIDRDADFFDHMGAVGRDLTEAEFMYWWTQVDKIVQESVLATEIRRAERVYTASRS